MGSPASNAAMLTDQPGDLSSEHRIPRQRTNRVHDNSVCERQYPLLMRIVRFVD